MMLAFGMECRKARRKHFWLMALLMAAAQCLWLAWAMRDLANEALKQGYMSCFYQFPLLNAIVMPVLIGVLTSRICDMEHRGAALKLLRTMQPAGRLFDAKLLLCALYLLAVTLAQVAGIVLIGRWRGFLDAPATSDIVLFVLGQFAVGLFLALLIQVLALRYQNQFIPMATGLILGFLGLMSMFFPPFIMRLTPASYYGLLSTMAMEWDPATRVVTYYSQPFAWGDMALLLAAFAALYAFGRRAFVRREV